MHRRLSSLIKTPSSGSTTSAFNTAESVDHDNADSESKVSTVRETIELPPPSLKVKRVDHYYSRWSKEWKYRNMNSKVTVETRPLMKVGDNDPWKDFSFVIVRKIPRQENLEPTFKIVVKSEYILKACKDVIQSWPGVSWNSDPLELDPEIFITFLPSFATYEDTLASKKSLSSADSHTLSSVSLLLSTLRADYRATLAKIHQLTSHGEITFDYLYAILVPRTTFIARCAITGEPRLLTLTSFVRTAVDGKPVYQLSCESVDTIDSVHASNSCPGYSATSAGSSSNASTSPSRIGKVQTTILLHYFRGTVLITTLDAYPLIYAPSPDKIKEDVLQRGKKWVGLVGVHHMQYSGIAALKCGDKVLRHNVNGRVMVDRSTFRRLNANYQFPTPVPPKTDPSRPTPGIRDPHSGLLLPPVPVYDPYNDASSITPPPTTNNGIQTTRPANEEPDVDLTDEELLLTPAVVYGFSLSDKIWLEFNVEKISPVDWSLDAFANLVLPADRKNLLQSLVEAHHRELGFDDFIKGKGHGLVINLFGPPGVGKTFSAEATSEHVQRPLYVIGGGDLGTRASELDATLERVFDVATAWKAIVLIDEADVFLEQRSLHDLERNAMVAVFLRHVEYYRGILFLTTNRVQAFDEAFLSRIHVALHFHELSLESKKQVWRAFIAKAGCAPGEISEDELGELAKRNVNGRQIKNAARTAHSLALGRKEKVGFGHFLETLDAMDEFTREFEGMRVTG